MRVELAAHDAVLRTAIESHGGWLFKHTGDGACAAFSSATAAVASAVEAQRELALPVRMGVGTGEAELRGEDYFGPALNRAARVMAAGHGGQILVAASTAGLLDGVDVLDLGSFRLRDLSGLHRLFQVQAEGLQSEFPPLRTLDGVPGNLPLPATSLVGRDRDVVELAGLVRQHRMVTLVGVGGVGKTRLALHLAAALVPDFPDGVWLVELAPVLDPAAVADAVAGALGITAQAGVAVSDSIARALSGRRLLIVLDNCEHVLDSAAELVEALLGRTPMVKVIATSREGLRVPAEQQWAVPALDTAAGASSAAVELFVVRAQSAIAGFTLQDDEDTSAVVELCRRLDGIALAIELAAARMVSMSPAEVLERLRDRFRLLAGALRGLERHATLRHAVGWSYDLLNDAECSVLRCCSAFADGFDLAAATQVCGPGFDEYAVLDVLDSLVRKSLITAERSRGSTRYGMLETIRQFADDQLAETGIAGEVRLRHAAYFAAEAMLRWQQWNGARPRAALDWVDVEFANLRAGFRWAIGSSELACAAAIAAHTAMLAWTLQLYEPVGWVEEVLPAAAADKLQQLPRLYTAASLCAFNGRPDTAIGYASATTALEADPEYESFEGGWSSFCSAVAYRMAGQNERWIEICEGMANQAGVTRIMGLCGMLYGLPTAGRSEEAMAIADETLAAARAHGNPFWIAFAMDGYGRAFAQTDPAEAITVLRQGLDYTREHRLALFEAFIARDLAGLEALHGDLERGLELFERNIDSLLRAGDVAHLSSTLANLAVFFDRVDRPELAATLYGTTTGHASITRVIGLPTVIDHLRVVLGDASFVTCVAAGAAMELGEAAQYARLEIRRVREARDRS